MLAHLQSFVDKIICIHIEMLSKRWNQLVNWISVAVIMHSGLTAFYFHHAQWLDKE